MSFRPFVLRALGALAPLLLVCCGPEDTAVPPHAPPPTPPPLSTSATTIATEVTPALRLPADTRALSEKIELHVAPGQPRYTGSVDIAVQLDQPRPWLWLHGQKLHVTGATVTPEGAAPITGTWEERDARGTAALTLASPAPAGKASVHIDFDAALSDGRTGVFRATEGGNDYVFTQFEAIYARTAFPCFDEPGAKIPWSVTLVVPNGAQAVANTPEAERASTPDGSVRVRFADTKPLPSYLVAFAVGPLDILPAADVPPNAARAHPLPLRIVSPKGHAAELHYALAHSGEILATLEKYFGIAYPYEKLDLIVVPGGQGAMENAGAVTFDEPLLVFDEKTAPLRQKQAYAYVVAHELAHQWFGDLVTMQWWDDTWLNESFATWMGSKAADAWNPASEARMSLLGGVQGAIGTDSLVNARAIRQPIEAVDDIDNAFDDTTYQKGGGVLTMFERWLGEGPFREGVKLHLSQHAYGNATADDFLSALSTAAKRDVKGPMHSFLDQPGVPYVEAEVRCDGAPRVHLTQSRFLPRGSTGDANKTWQVPVCARYVVKGASNETCTLLTDREGDLPLEGGACPDWVFPNADAAGYFRFSLAAPDLAALRSKGVAALTEREKIAFGNSLRAAYNHGSTGFGDTLRAAATLASDANARVAREASGFVGQAYDWLHADPVLPSIEAYGRRLYAPSLAKLGWARGKDDDGQTIERRSSVIGFLADVGRDPAVRAEARKRGLAFIGFGKDSTIHRDAVDANLVGTALGVAGQEASPAEFDAMLAQLVKTDDEVLRGELLGALSGALDPALASRARDLALDPRVHSTEVMTPIWVQLGAPETRDAAWSWLKQSWDKVWARISGNLFIGDQIMSVAEVFCDDAHAADAASFLGEKAKSVEGAPRALAKTLEDVHLCVVKRTADEADIRAFFKGAK